MIKLPQKKHIFSFPSLCVCIQGFNEKFMQIAQTSIEEYIAQFSLQVQFSNLFLKTKCVFFWHFIGITTAMNMISGNLTEVSKVIFVETFSFSFSALV